jgi:hypothetical protein
MVGKGQLSVHVVASLPNKKALAKCQRLHYQLIYAHRTYLGKKQATQAKQTDCAVCLSQPAYSLRIRARQTLPNLFRPAIYSEIVIV